MFPNQTDWNKNMIDIWPSDKIVVYDNNAVIYASRLWFMLVTHGAKDVYLLNGGGMKWKAEGRKLETGT